MLGLLISPAVLCNQGPVLGSILESLLDVSSHIRIIRVYHLERHHFHTRNVRHASSGHSADTDAVVVHCSHCSCYMGAMVHRIDLGIVRHEIESVHVVHESVAVIIPAVAGNLALVDPDIRLKIRMHAVHSAVDDSHDDILVSENSVFVPCPLETHVHSGTEAELPGIPIMPLILCIIRVIHADALFLETIDRFRTLHEREIIRKSRGRLCRRNF